MSKHSLWQTLLQQICNINDVAALADNWAAADVQSWLLKWISWVSGGVDHVSRELEPNHPCDSCVTRWFQHFSLAMGFLDFNGDLRNPQNMASYPDFAAHTALEFSRMFHPDLLFFCALHRLQQLPHKAVLVACTVSFQVLPA